ncbi:MAG: hypothetical protein US98_C0001G0001, partial [Parcubacteria group bacterium GW2011_GWC1_38_6]
METLIIYYQFFSGKNTTEKEVNYRQKVIWEIIDNYYAKLSKKINDDQTLRLLLARIDRRKIIPTLEEKDDKVLIKFIPEIEPDLKKYTEESQQIYSEKFKYTPLKLWATNKFEKNIEYKKYKQYENNPNLVLKETKEIFERLENNNDFFSNFLERSTPAYTCSILIREYEKE